MFSTKLKTAALSPIVVVLLASGVGSVGDESETPRDEHRRESAVEVPREPAPAQAKAASGEPVRNKLEGRSRLVKFLPHKSNVKKGDLICEFDASELEDRLSDQEIQLRVIESAYQVAKLKHEVAEIAMTQYKEGLYRLELQEIKGGLALAEMSRKIAEAEFEALRKIHENSDLAVLKARRKVSRATFAFESAATKLSVLQNFTYDRKVKELNGDVAKNRAEGSTAKMKFDLEKKKRQALSRAIEDRKIHAPGDGVVIPNSEIKPGSDVDQGTLLFHFVPAAQALPSR